MSRFLQDFKNISIFKKVIIKKKKKKCTSLHEHYSKVITQCHIIKCFKVRVKYENKP